MSNNYDNWERLVVAVLRREKDRQLALAHSRESSFSSGSSSFNFGLDSPVSLQLEASSSKVNETDLEILFPSATSSRPGLSRFSAAASGGFGEILPTLNLKIFSLADLKIATGNFKPDMILGVGDFGTVFKGWVDSKTLSPSKVGTGMMVAIKKLKPESRQWFKEWQSEVNILERLSHPNLVKLHGYCWEDKEFLLVYEFMQWGSLEDDLFIRNVAIEPSSWDIRLKIAIGAARGLAFLHTSEKQVIYRDFKASNILIDVNYNAKISDYNLAKFCRPVIIHVCSAPEFVETGHFSLKSEVYGFGVVLFQIFSGLSVFDPKRYLGQKNLVDYAKSSLSQESKLISIVDARMEGQYSPTVALQAGEATHLALRCLETDPTKRPSMEEVRETLEQIGQIVEVLITSPYPLEEDSDVPQPYTSEDDYHEESEDEQPEEDSDVPPEGDS